MRIVHLFTYDYGEMTKMIWEMNPYPKNRSLWNVLGMADEWRFGRVVRDEIKDTLKC